jgi:hypothetical protein
MMKVINFQVRSGSSEKIYNVQFTLKDSLIQFKCDCRAGIFNKFCKHKLAIALGSPNMIDENQDDDLYFVQTMLQQTELFEHIEAMQKDFRVIREAEERIRPMRARIEKMTKEGIEWKSQKSNI